jgi:hypothetical protein
VLASYAAWMRNYLQSSFVNNIIRDVEFVDSSITQLDVMRYFKREWAGLPDYWPFAYFKNMFM